MLKQVTSVIRFKISHVNLRIFNATWLINLRGLSFHVHNYYFDVCYIAYVSVHVDDECSNKSR